VRATTAEGDRPVWRESSMECPTCGAAVRSASRFCEACGAPLAASPPRALDAGLQADLSRCTDAYRRLFRDLEEGRASPDDFVRRAVRAGIVVRETDAWIADLAQGCWHRYDGFRLERMEPIDARDPAGGATLREGAR
jgi:hypothetical protein